MTLVDEAPAYRARVVLHYDSEAFARVVADALTVETREPVPRATAVVDRDAATLHVTFTARDATSLRAVVNSYVRWAAVAEDAARAVHGNAGE